jgi:hypothetical protein
LLVVPCDRSQEARAAPAARTTGISSRKSVYRLRDAERAKADIRALIDQLVRYATC